MEDNKRFNYIIIGFICALLMLFSINLFAPMKSMWGINHLSYIERPITYLFFIPLLIIFSSIFIKERIWSKFLDTLHTLLFSNNNTFILFLIIITSCFFFLKVDTFFLGDGYAWIASFSYSKYFLVKPTAFLSAYIIRSIQFLLGDYSKEVSLQAFQIVSIVSGFVFFFILRMIINLLLKDKRYKVFCFLSFLFSGLVLLFFGYVEFYPMLWMFAALFVYLSLKALESTKYSIWAVLSFFLLILIHAQAIYYSFGFLYLLLHKKISINKILQNFHKYKNKILSLIVLTSLVGLYFLYSNFKITQILLPLFTSNNENPNYFVFSPSHLLDIFNQIILLFPFFLFFPFIILPVLRRLKLDVIGIFLLLSSIGSLFFLFFVNPYIGFIRDWDLMSLSLFIPYLLTFYLFDSLKYKFNSKLIICSLVCLVMLSTSFLYVNINKNNALHRIETSIRINRGIQFRPSWTILNNYYVYNNEPEKSIELQKEMKIIFTDDDSLKVAYQYLYDGKLQEAKKISNYLIHKYPTNIDFIQLQGSVYQYFNNYDSTIYYFEKALSIQSTYPPVLKVYGNYLLNIGKLDEAIQILTKASSVTHEKDEIVELLATCYVRKGDIPTAVDFAKTIYEKDKQSSSYHLISMLIFIQTNNKEKAIYHYNQFLIYGANRDDFEEIKQTFSFVLN